MVFTLEPELALRATEVLTACAVTSRVLCQEFPLRLIVKAPRQVSAGRFAGWRFSPYLALEGGFVDFDKADGDTIILGQNVNGQISAKALYGNLVGSLPLGDRARLFGKVGLAGIDPELTTDTFAVILASDSVNRATFDGNSTLLFKEFPVRDNLVYLNHAAVSPLPRRSGDAIKRFVDEYVHYGTKNYLKWSDDMQQLHEDLATFINAASADDIALLKNTSEGISVVAMGFPWQPGDVVLSSDEEFPSNRIPWQALADQGVEFREIALRQPGKTPEQALIDAMDNNKVRMLAISAVQYASGLHLDLEVLGAACKERNIAFCVDAIQMLGALPCDVRAAHIDFLMADAHKWLMGPEGIAVFYCTPAYRDMIKLFQYGWHMIENAGDFDQREWQPAASARRFENGTPNILGAVGFAASLSLINDIGIEVIEQRVLHHTDLLHNLIEHSTNLEAVYTDAASRKSGIVTFRSHQCPAPQLFKALREEGVMCAERGGGVRFSPHVYNTDDELANAIAMADGISA